MQEIITPGEPPSPRPLHFIWILDCSGSMRANGKIQALNWAIHEATPHMQSTARSNPDAQMLVRALKFADVPEWHVEEPTPVDTFAWSDVTARGATALGAALKVVAEQLRMPPMEQRALQPVLALISDGDPTDEWEEGLVAIEREQWGRRALRVAIAIGDDANRDVLARFMGETAQFDPLKANNPEALVQMIRWVSTSLVNAASQPQPRREPGTESGLGIPPEFVPDTSAPTVWGRLDT
jgi:uncharacterized protein YegL